MRWSHIIKVEVTNITSDSSAAPFKVGDHLLTMRNEFLVLPIFRAQVGDTIENIHVRRDTFSPKFEPSVFYNLIQNPQTIPIIETRADWEQLDLNVRKSIVSGFKNSFLEAMQIKKTSREGKNIELPDEQPHPGNASSLLQLKAYVENNISLEVEDEELTGVATLGDIQYKLELFSLSNNELVGAKLRIVQKGVMEGNDTTLSQRHYQTAEEALAAGAVLDADVKWSAEALFYWSDRSLEVISADDRLSWSGH